MEALDALILAINKEAKRQAIENAQADNRATGEIHQHISDALNQIAGFAKELAGS
jgi:hypothetical protein